MKYPIYKNPVFRADIEPKDGFTKVTVGGLLSPVLGQAMSKEMSFFDKQKYIA